MSTDDGFTAFHRVAEGRMVAELRAELAAANDEIVRLTKLSAERERYDAAKHALMGLLADHKEHGEECKDGESCTDAVAGLAIEHGDSLLKQLTSYK